jgi:hypothetical protein
LAALFPNSAKLLPAAHAILEHCCKVLSSDMPGTAFLEKVWNLQQPCYLDEPTRCTWADKIIAHHCNPKHAVQQVLLLLLQVCWH